MCWHRTLALFLLSSPAVALEGYIVAAGVDADTENAIAATLSAELGLGENTWLSTAIATSRANLPLGNKVETLYGDLGIDHWFEPIGIRAGVAYWGDSDTLDSVNYRGSLYWRNDKFSLSANLERRNFSFDIFRQVLGDGQDFEFHANGVGLSGTLALNKSVDLSFSAMDYDYNINLGAAANRPIADFLTVSRLRLLNSLTDYRARIAIGVDVGQRRWSLDYSKGKGVVDRRTINSMTLNFLTPVGQRSDIEFSLGIDRSEDFDSVTLFSVFFYFYG